MVARPLRLSIAALCVAVSLRSLGAVHSPGAVPEAARGGVGRPVARLAVFGARPSGRPAARYAKLDGSLAQIAERYASSSAPPSVAELHVLNPAARFRLAPPLATPEVLVDAISAGNPRDLLAALRSLGLRGAAVFSNDVGGWLPVDQIQNAAALSELRFARASMPRARGAVATQGDFAQGTSGLRSTYPGLTGTGITVGVLSDSFNCYETYAEQGVPASGFNGYASNGFTADYPSDVQSGALPSNVNVLEEASCMNYGAPYQLPFSDEGRGILQIVHSVAPGAQLAFYTGAESEADFATGIVQLQKAGANIIADDIGYPDEPFFQDGLLAQAVDQVAAAGVAYFSAAGNDGRSSYENTAPSFVPAAGTGPLLNFDTSGQTTTTTLPLTIPALVPGEYVYLVLEWNQPYVTGAPGSPGASSSLDLCVTSASGSDVILNGDGEAASCTGSNATGVDPLQILIVGNPANSGANTASESISISIALENGTAAPGLVKLLASGGGPVSIDQFATNSPTIQGHPGATGAAAVGAAWYFLTPLCGTTPATLETFSSAGGDPILFDTSGNPLPSPTVRAKPQFVAPDGVNNTFLGFTLESDGLPGGELNTTIAACQNDPSYPNFFGTSAATPHAAGAAALLWQANPALTAPQIITALQSSALAMASSTAGYNYDSGFGFIQPQAALSLLPPGVPSLSVSPTTVAPGQAATLTWSSIGTTSCSASGSWSGTQAVSGTMQVTPEAVGSQTYTLMCSGNGGSASSSVKLSVVAAAASDGGSTGHSGGGGGIDALTLAVLLATLLIVRGPPTGARLRVPPRRFRCSY